MKTNKKYWLVLLLPITAIVIIAVFLIPGKKHHDWDDDEEEEEAVGIPIDEEHFPDDADAGRKELEPLDQQQRINSNT